MIYTVALVFVGKTLSCDHSSGNLFSSPFTWYFWCFGIWYYFFFHMYVDNQGNLRAKGTSKITLKINCIGV